MDLSWISTDDTTYSKMPMPGCLPYARGEIGMSVRHFT